MFAASQSNRPIIEARYVSCSHCGHEARTGLKISRQADQLTADSRGSCPRCGKPADIRSRVSSGRVLDVYSRMRVLSRPITLIRTRLQRVLGRLRKTALAGLGAALAVAVATPAMAGAVTRAMEYEVSARTAWPAARDAEGFCDARIQAYRHAPAEADAWTELEAHCPIRADIITELRGLTD